MDVRAGGAWKGVPADGQRYPLRSAGGGCRSLTIVGESVGIEKIKADYSDALFRELDQMIEQEGLIDIFYERAFERLIPQGHTFKVIDTTRYFSYELDTPEDFERATQLLPQELI